MSKKFIKRNNLRIKQLREKQNAYLKKNKRLDNIISGLFVLGLFLTAWEILIYRNTIINVNIPLLIFLVPGIFLTPIFYKKLNEIDPIEVYDCDTIFKLFFSKIGLLRLLPSKFKIPNTKADLFLWVFMHYLLHTIITGGILMFLFMATNFYFADNSIIEKRFKIEKIDSLPGSKGEREKRQPYVVIDYEGMKKELIFSYEETEKVKTAKYAVMKVSKGFLGYDILKEKDVE